MTNTVRWWNWDFEVHVPPVRWNAVAGLYIFAGLDLTRTLWRPFYIGQTESLAERLPTHEYWQEAVRLGATHIHARVEPQAVTRQAMERILIQQYQPRLNSQHR